MTTQQKTIIKNTWLTVAKLDGAEVGALFYNRLFYIAPEVRALFRNPVPEQSKKLMAMLHYMVCNIDQPEEVVATVSALAKRHVRYWVKRYQYAIVGNALLWTLEQGLGAIWSDAAEEAWAMYYTQLSEAMLGVTDSQKVMA